MIFKTCPKCGLEKYHYTGRPSQCVDCSRKYQKALYNKKHSKKPGDPDGRTRKYDLKAEMEMCRKWNADPDHAFRYTLCQAIINHEIFTGRITVS